MNAKHLITLAMLSAATLGANAQCTDQHVAPPESAMGQAYAPGPDMVSRTEVFELAIPAEEFNERLAKAPLEKILPSTDELPGVVGTRPLADKPFGEPGGPRLVCLSDGSTATEEAIRSEPGKVFQYRVWNYNSKAAAPILYGIGTFALTPTGPSRTRVEWTYSFKLKEDRFPGNLGGVGRWLFNTMFLSSDFAELMRTSSEAMKVYFVK